MKPKPVCLAYVVETIGEDETFWTCIGAAFQHKDQLGMNLVLRALPVGGRIVLRKYNEKPARGEAIPEADES